MDLKGTRTSLHLKSYCLLLLVFGIGIIGGYLLEKLQEDTMLSSLKKSLFPIMEQGTPYTFVHPLLAYRTPEATLLGDYTSLKDTLQSITGEATQTGTSRAAVYFRDLDAARWVGINQDDKYYPASLLKVPVLIAYDKQVEANPSLLLDTITYDPSVLPNIPFEVASTLVSGQRYSLQELLNYMIIDSDNGATFTLLHHINPEVLNATYTALGIPDPGENSVNYEISARTYGLFFRILYNATYLSADSSDKALKLLSKTTFDNGLVAGVPKGTVVAHKYGEHILSTNGAATGVELSDCGIVYYPSHPYLLCVMTSSKDMDTASSFIASISNAAYAAVKEQYPTK